MVAPSLPLEDSASNQTPLSAINEALHVTRPTLFSSHKLPPHHMGTGYFFLDKLEIMLQLAGKVIESSSMPRIKDRAQ